ncbi:O-antigen polysaccharide polymerase Wzy family protein [Streptomyces sp. ST2-7A]|uniref:O-antigen polysaccharide polymerase Wzy family protein n=1 Tax=Streptomyces sp. ST2-7A TaxID=2907214 RepID=UPI001F202E42|nr:O-antigen polysaccharide polymerase Wzy family protein [Streptomyces sp. ST2-7A]MCE7081309.1 O-antigen polysaccharide polymerase Wzy family protein [Streptomyces sp. ST2-7A]
MAVEMTDRPRRTVGPRDLRDRAQLSRATALPLIFGIVAVMPVAVAAQSGEGVRDTAFVLQLALACYAGVRLCTMVLSGRRRLIQGVFWLFCYLAMGIAPLAQSVLGRDPTPVLGPRSDTVLATTLVLLGLVAFDVGAMLARHRPTLGNRVRPPARVHRTRLYLLIGVAYAGSLVFIASLGPEVFFTSRQELGESLEASGGSDGGEAGNALLRGFGTVPVLLALLLTTRWLVTSRRARRSPSVLLPWAGLVVLNIVVNNPMSNPRYWFLTVMFALLFTLFPRSPVMYRASLALGVVMALLVFPFADRFRYDEDGHRPMDAGSVLEPLVVKDYDQVPMIANTITYAEDGNGHTYGKQLSGSLLFFVPRSLWSDKPVDTGVRVGEWMGTTNTNLSAPLWAELWLDFGPLGMSLGFLALGYAAARTDRRYVQRTVDDPSPGNIPAIVVPVIAGYSFILLRGPLLQATGRIAIAAFCLALVTTFRDDPHRRLE